MSICIYKCILQYGLSPYLMSYTQIILNEAFSCIKCVLCRVFWIWKHINFQTVYHIFMLFMVTAAWKIHWPFNAFRWLHKQKHTDKHTPDGHTPPPSPLTLGSPWQQVKTGPTWTRHFWFAGEASLFLRFLLFFIVTSCLSVSLIANECRSACAGLLLQARWDSMEMTFGGWPTWCNHNAARDLFFF